MASIAMLAAGAALNAVAFSGSNYLFWMLGGGDAGKEQKRHDLAIEQLNAAHTAWSQRRTERLDWINADLRRQQNSVHSISDVDQAMKEYSLVTGHSLPPLGPEPKLSDYYTPSDEQMEKEIGFIVLGLGITGLVAYTLL